MKKIKLQKNGLGQTRFSLIKEKIATLSDLESHLIVGASVGASNNYWCATTANTQTCATQNCGGSGPATTGLAGCASDTQQSNQATTCQGYTCVHDAQTWCV